MTLPEQKTLTVKLDIDLLAEFAVAVRVMRGRSVSSHLHQFVVNQVNEARKMIPPEEFARMVEEQRDVTRERSESRSRSFGVVAHISPSDEVRQKEEIRKQLEEQIPATDIHVTQQPARGRRSKAG